MSGETPVLVVRDLEVRYGGRVVASLPELDLGRGGCVAIVGESGSGKTTSLLALLGLLPSGAAVQGSVLLAGTEIVGASERALQEVRGRRIALVLQSPHGSLNPTMRLGVYLRRVLARHGVRGDEAVRRATEAFADVRLPPDIGRRFPHEISGGQAQRFAIAIAVALGADVIAADEPTSALDVTVQAEVIGVLRRLREQHGTALLLVSHDLALVSTAADHVVVMRDGETVEAGPVAAVLGAPSHEYTRALIEAVPRLPATEDPA